MPPSKIGRGVVWNVFVYKFTFFRKSCRTEATFTTRSSIFKIRDLFQSWCGNLLKFYLSHLITFRYLKKVAGRILKNYTDSLYIVRIHYTTTHISILQSETRMRIYFPKITFWYLETSRSFGLLSPSALGLNFLNLIFIS